jgi:hypothetical protein
MKYTKGDLVRKSAMVSPCSDYGLLLITNISNKNGKGKKERSVYEFLCLGNGPMQGQKDWHYTTFIDRNFDLARETK